MMIIALSRCAASTELWRARFMRFESSHRR